MLFFVVTDRVRVIGWGALGLATSVQLAVAAGEGFLLPVEPKVLASYRSRC